MEKYCKHCNVVLNQENVYASLQKRGALTCKTCCKLNYKKNITSDKSKLYGRIKNLVYKQDILNEYGNKCTCCKEKIWQFLTLDHINNTGAKHRKEIGKSGGQVMYQWLKKHNYFKEGFRI